MAINDSLIYQIPSTLIDKASTLITILEVLGGVIIFYIIFNIINIIMNKNKGKKIDRIIYSLEEIKNLLAWQKSSQYSRAQE